MPCSSPRSVRRRRRARLYKQLAPSSDTGKSGYIPFQALLLAQASKFVRQPGYFCIPLIELTF